MAQANLLNYDLSPTIRDMVGFDPKNPPVLDNEYHLFEMRAQATLLITVGTANDIADSYLRDTAQAIPKVYGKRYKHSIKRDTKAAIEESDKTSKRSIFSLKETAGFSDAFNIYLDFMDCAQDMVKPKIESLEATIRNDLTMHREPGAADFRAKLETTWWLAKMAQDVMRQFSDAINGMAQATQMHFVGTYVEDESGHFVQITPSKVRRLKAEANLFADISMKGVAAIWERLATELEPASRQRFADYLDPTKCSLAVRAAATELLKTMTDMQALDETAKNIRAANYPDYKSPEEQAEEIRNDPEKRAVVMTRYAELLRKENDKAEKQMESDRVQMLALRNRMERDRSKAAATAAPLTMTASMIPFTSPSMQPTQQPMQQTQPLPDSTPGGVRGGGLEGESAHSPAPTPDAPKRKRTTRRTPRTRKLTDQHKAEIDKIVGSKTA